MNTFGRNFKTLGKWDLGLPSVHARCHMLLGVSRLRQMTSMNTVDPRDPCNDERRPGVVLHHAMASLTVDVLNDLAHKWRPQIPVFD